MKMLRVLIVIALACWGFSSPPSVQAACEVHTSVPTYTDLQFIGADLCDAHGNKYVTTGGASGATGGTANAAAPTLTEATTYGFFLDLAGNMRVTIPLLWGEDSTNNLLQTSGGNTRQLTVVGGPAVAATDATSSTFILPVGRKTFQAVLSCTGTCTQVHNIYGTAVNTAATTNAELLCTITLSDTTKAHKSCDVISSFSFYFDITSGTGGTTPLSTLYAQF